MSNSKFDSTIIPLPYDEIKVGVNIKNIRTVFAEASIRELADSIFNEGLMMPLVFAETEENGSPIYELVAGERRLRAIGYIRTTMDPTFMDEGVPCISYTGSMSDAEDVNAYENIEREDVDEVDISAYLFRQTEAGKTQTEMAQKLHKQVQWVSMRVSFHTRSCDELKQLVRDGLISLSAAYELSKNMDHEGQRKKCKKARLFNEKITHEQAVASGDPNKSVRPGKKERQLVTALSTKLAEEGNDFARGVAMALKWVDGLQSTPEVYEALGLDDPTDGKKDAEDE